MNARRAGLWSWGALGALGLSWGVAWSCGVRVNISGSVPLGLWRETPLQGQIQRGQVVAVCPEDNAAFRLAKSRGYIEDDGWCPDGSQLMFKPVAAVAGDLVRVSDAGVSVNGSALPNSAPLKRDYREQPLPTLQPGSYTVQPGTVWLVSSYNSRSFDSRYFGAVSASAVRGVVTPLWTQGQRSQRGGGKGGEPE